MINCSDLSKIGIGTWGIGGFAECNPDNNDKKQIEALTYTLNKGINFVEICYWYAGGKAVELFKRSLDQSTKKVEDIFLSVSLYQHRNPTVEGIEAELNKVKQIFGVNQVDNTLVTFSGIKVWGQKETLKFLHKIIDSKQTRYVSLTNSNLEMIKLFHKEFGDKFFDHELTYSFEIRENEDMGIVKYGDEIGIRNVVWQPLRRNATANRNWELLVNLAQKYGKSQNQVVINWLVSKRLLPLIKSESIKHINENLDALNFTIESDDLRALNEFRPAGWVTPKIDWNKTGDGVSVSQLPTIFDEKYNKEKQGAIWVP